MYVCKQSILEVYGINKLDTEELARKIQWLLTYDCCICREDGRKHDVGASRRIWYLLTCTQEPTRYFKAPELTEVIFRKYFATRKMRGNKDITFFDSINEVFICLVASVMRYCLKPCRTVVYEEKSRLSEFKYETSLGKYPIRCHRLFYSHTQGRISVFSIHGTNTSSRYASCCFPQ